MNPDDLSDRLLHRDGNMLILDKPAGLAVHPGPRTPHSLELYLPTLAFGLPRPPSLAHRLDRDTAGCLVLAPGQITGLLASGARMSPPCRRTSRWPSGTAGSARSKRPTANTPRRSSCSLA